MEEAGSGLRSELRDGKRGRRGIRAQLYLTCVMMLVLTVFVGAALGMIAYESTWNYHTSMQAVADVHKLSGYVNTWDAAMEEYVLNGSELNQEECGTQWKRLGSQLQGFYSGGARETEQLILENLCALYRNGEADMAALFSADDNSVRLEHYRELIRKRDGLLFLADQLLKNNLEYEAQNYPVIVERNFESMKLVLLILAAAFLMMIVCSVRVVHAVYTPIDLLVRDARQIGAGNYDTPEVEIINDDELGYLSGAFNDMKKAVSANFKSMKRIMELQDLLQDVELKALQAQINPHFLFNVLAVAEEAALRERADQTVEIVENISYMLQYSLKCTKQDTTLPEELRTVRSYLFLQEKRFGDRISFVFSAPEEIPAIRIPGMSLQPIVENAIKHGVERMETDGWVHVQVRERVSYIEVMVSDNGRGIDPELLSAIRCQESDRAGSGIGLINTSRRMEMFYRQKGLFEINSTPGKGTSVVLRYPISAKEVPHV